MLSNDPVKVLAACPVQVRYLSFDAFEPGMILGEPILWLNTASFASTP